MSDGAKHEMLNGQMLNLEQNGKDSSLYREFLDYFRGVDFNRRFGL